MKPTVHYSAPMLHVADVERSVKFQELMGFTATGILKTDDSKGFLAWLHATSAWGKGELSVTDPDG